MDNKYAKFFETNKETWNKKVAFHKDSDFYDVQGFLKGKTSLNSFELNELGNVKEKTLLHLQCHFGLDTLSWSRLGAKCTGIDISEEGIKQAKILNKKIGSDTEFIESNVYNVSENVKGQFDIVFTSYGVIGWLPDLDIWAKIIADKLVSGGTFYMIEFHPIVWMFDYLKEPIEMAYKYSNDGVVYEEYEGTYAKDDAAVVSKEYNWNHGLGEVITALTNVGLRIEFLHEFYESPYDCLPNMVKNKNNNYVFKDTGNLFPLIYSIKATK
jgi:SAM-dependent methyltransferase